jgi:predicted glycogen debranching enzyme
MVDEAMDRPPEPDHVAELTRHVPVRRISGGDINTLLDREWLVANGLGGYASGTVSGAATRRYHGLLIAAHPAPLGRVMMWNHLTEHFRLPDYRGVAVGGAERVGGRVEVEGADALREFRLEMGLPIWRFEIPGHVIEKRVWLPHRQNTVHLTYRLVEGMGPIRLKLRPSCHFRGHNDPVSHLPKETYVLTASAGRYELSGGAPWPKLRFCLHGEGAALTLDGVRVPDVLYRVEENRGYEGVGA